MQSIIDQYKIKAKSSSGGYYEVTVTNSGSSITVFCTCDAGKQGKLCRHKTEILDGDIDSLFDLNEKDDLNRMTAIVDRSTYRELRKEHLQIKTDVEAMQKREKHVRLNIETSMKKGISLSRA